MNHTLNKKIALFLVMVLLITGLPTEFLSSAATTPITLQVTYNANTRKYDISYLSSVEPAKTILTYHGPDGTLHTHEDEETYQSGRVTVSVDLLPDHIYDLSLDVYMTPTDTQPSYHGSLYYLADITFLGESFNVMSNASGIEDKNPAFEYLQYNGVDHVVAVRSGENPVVRLKWKIPTIYHNDGDPSTSDIVYVTSSRALGILQDPAVPLSKTCFQINMTVGHGSTRVLNFNTDYQGSDMIIEGKNVTVSGITNGNVTSADKFVTVDLGKAQGIESGTEYEFTNIGLIFENAESEQIPIRRTNLRTDSDNRFAVKNIDNVFADVGYDLSSIYTPMEFEMTKVDSDKVEIRFKKIVNGVYPELFYQVQYAPRIDDLYTQTNKWVKIPDSALPSSELYGSEIVTIPVSGADHPEYYFRVVYFDSSSALPRSSSLSVDLRLLGTESGKPPLPREIKVEAEYIGRKTVTVPTTGLSSGDVEVPLSDLRLSFEKPLAWRQITNWEAYKANDYGEDDYTFHVLLSTYLPDTSVQKQIKTVGLSNTKDIYMPVKQKRVLVLGKKDFIEDPEDKNRLICVIPGDKLFYDYVDNQSLSFENTEDPSEDGNPGDYPTFLVPNTTYYLQLFVSRKKDNADINADVWGDPNGLSADLNNRLSYKSPIISFTTWPLNELPVPMPNLQLGIEPETYVDPVSGNLTLAGISVSYERVLTDVEWRRYTRVTTGRAIVYEFYISRDPSQFDTQPIVTDTAVYPDEAELIKRGVTITSSGITLPNGQMEPILPNTVYYVKARSSLVVGGIVIGRSAETAVKAITTPKIDTGGLDNVHREPRAPSEFDIAKDANGQDLLSDAWVIFNWLHAEKDVTYELVCTTVNLSPQAITADFQNDPFNVGFLNAYSEFADNYRMVINVNDPTLAALGFSVNAEGGVTLPIRRDFLRPNRIYYFSLRAVRNRGMTDPSGNSLETVSRWVTVPVTTHMVKSPEQFEAVKDLEIGFNVQLTYSGATADSVEVYLKKAEAADSQYVLLNRSDYTSVLDGFTYYVRIYNLEPNQWYDVRLKNKMNNTWYDQSSGTWKTQTGSPVKAKTRDPLTEIEVRWEGQDPYTYYLEARSEKENDYEKLIYSATGFTNYGYDLVSGGRIMFYREKTNLHVQEGSGKYIYYAKISGKPVRDSQGNVQNLPLRSNTLYYVKLWAFNLEESLHVGPVTMRTDFSQSDYDKDKKKDGVIDLYNDAADGLMQKLYWLVDVKAGTSLRVILKDDMLSGMLRAAIDGTVTVDLSGENANATYYEILIPYKTLEAVETYDSRLNIKVVGGEFTLNRGSIDLNGLKSQIVVNGAKEPMLLLKIEKSKTPKTVLPSGLVNASPYYTLEASAIGSRLTYAEISTIIHDILKKPDAKGPFKYGILDRELSIILRDLDSYSYRSHTDLKDLIQGVMKKVETELSRYLKDVLDGGSGLPKDFVLTRAITAFPGGLGVKLEYTYQSGLTLPYVNTSGSWKEPAGAKGYVANIVLFRVDGTGQYTVVVKASAPVQPGSPFDTTISKLSARYDLTKVFGKGTINPANPVKGDQAVMLYAVLIKRDNEIAGMTPRQQATTLGIGDVVGTKQLTGYMDNQTSVSLAVKLYCTRANISADLLKPTKTIHIANGSEISSNLYRYVTLGVDLNLTTLQNQRFDATGRTSIGALLDMMSKALEKFE